MANKSQPQPDSPQSKALAGMQRPRITGEDCQILSIFKDDEDLVLAVRNLFMGFKLSDNEVYLITDRLASKSVKGVLKKMFLPELKPEIPIGQNMDLWMTSDIVEATPETFELVYETKLTLIELIKQSLELLEDIESVPVDLSTIKNLAFLKARTGYINHVTAVLYDVVMNANRPLDSEAEILKKLTKNSSR